MFSALDTSYIQSLLHGSFLGCTTSGDVFGFKLVPGDEKKRCWWLLADTEESLNEWFSVSVHITAYTSHTHHYVTTYAASRSQ